MKTLLFAAVALSAVALGGSAAAQTGNHSRHTPGAGRTEPPPATDPACPPEHAAMGHCTPKPAAKTPPPPTAPRMAPVASDPNCPPEHAAMGHCTPNPAASTPPSPTAPRTAPVASDPNCPPEHAAMGHCTPATRPKDDRAAPSAPAAGGTALPAGNAPAPAAPRADYADRIWGRDAMASARDLLHREHGGMRYWQVMVNLAELRIRNGRDGYRWDGEAWYGGDVHRVTIKSEGEGTFREDAGGEVQALYSRAVGPYFNLQAGLRQDVVSGSDRTYATIGFEGLAPYWFDVEGAVFLSDRGAVSARIEGYYDQRITQRLMLQPRAELNLSAGDVPGSRLGSGVTGAELGLRLRYEIVREFAPYLGVSWERTFGDTARFARAAGDGTGGFSLVSGIRTWF